MEWESTLGENIMYGGDTPIEAVLSLAIDDGVPSRGHRDNIFKKDFYLTGVATAMHQQYRSETVTTFAGLWTPDTSYVAPTISVPKKAAEYKDYAVWDSASTCGGVAGELAETNWNNATFANSNMVITPLLVLASVLLSTL